MAAKLKIEKRGDEILKRPGELKRAITSRWVIRFILKLQAR
jgi:hypothetical protein